MAEQPLSTQQAGPMDAARARYLEKAKSYPPEIRARIEAALGVKANVPLKAKERTSARGLVEEFVTKPALGGLAVAGQELGLLPKKATVKLPLVREPYTLPKTGLGKTGAVLDSALTIGTLGIEKIPVAIVTSIGKLAAKAVAKGAAKEVVATAAKAAVKKAAAEGLSTFEDREFAALLRETEQVPGFRPKVPETIPGLRSSEDIARAHAASEAVYNPAKASSTFADDVKKVTGGTLEDMKAKVGKVRETVLPKTAVAVAKPVVEETAEDVAKRVAKREIDKIIQSKLPPAVEAAKKTRFFHDLGETAALSAGFGVAKGLQMEDKSTSERIKTALQIAALGPLAHLGLKGLGKGVGMAAKVVNESSALGKLRGSSFYDHMLGESKNVLRTLGPEGDEIANRFIKHRKRWEANAGKYFNVLEKSWEKLSVKERKELVKLIDSGADIPDKLEKAYLDWENYSNLAAGQAKRFDIKTRKPTKVTDPATGKTSVSWEDVPWRPRANFFPRVMDTTKLTPKGYKIYSDSLIAKGQAKDEADAMMLIDHVFRDRRQRRASNLEFARTEFRPPDELLYDDPLISLQKYVDNTERRFADIEYFGGSQGVDKFGKELWGKADDEVMKLLAMIKNRSTDKEGQLATDIVNRILGREESFYGEPEFLSKARQLSMFSLGLAPISNAFQSINTATTAGIRNTVRGLFRFMTEEGKDFAKNIGAINEATIRELAPDLTGGSVEKGLHFMFKWTGMQHTEKWNKGIAANAGRYAIFDNVQKFYKNPTQSVARQLEDLGLMVKTPDYRSGPMNSNILVNPIKHIDDPRIGDAAKSFVDMTQFRSGTMDLPIMWTHPYTKFITQFKNFPYKQAQFIGKQVFAEAANGNMKPLLRFVTLGAALGEVPASVRAWARDPTHENEHWKSPAMKHFVENFAAVGSIGLLTDVITAASSSKAAAIGFFAGPTIGKLSDVLFTGSEAVQGNAKPLGKFAASQVPVFGPALKNSLFPKE